MDRSEVKNVIVELRVHHSRQANLCDELEALADSLPSSVDNQHCLTIARKIFPTVRQAHEFEERILFPVLSALPGCGAELGNSLERLRFEHWEDESFAEELSDSLRQYGSAEGGRDGEKLSYMLRGFFDGLRRHMAFEAEHLLPMLKVEITANSLH